MHPVTRATPMEVLQESPESARHLSNVHDEEPATDADAPPRK